MKIHVWKYLCSEAALQRISQRKMLCKHEAHFQEKNHTEAQSQQSRFATFLKSHPRTDVLPKIRGTHAKNSPSEE